MQSGAALRYGDIGLDGTLFAKSVPGILDGTVKTLLLGSFSGTRVSRPELPGTVRLLEDLGPSPAAFDIQGIALWSLQAVMPEGVEKSGFVLTGSAEEAEKLRRLRLQGVKSGALWNYDVDLRGGDTTISVLAAAVALRRIESLDAVCARTRAHAAMLDRRLGGHNLFDVMRRAVDAVPEAHGLLLTPQLYCPKEDIFTTLTQRGVEAGVCCKPIYKTTLFRDEEVRLPVTEDFYKAFLQLPCHHRLDAAEVETVAETLLGTVDDYAYRGCSF